MAHNIPKSPQRITTGFSFSNVERSLQEGLGERQFGKKEQLMVIRFFGENPLRCVYCGSTEVKRWDHLVSVSQGGETLVGNMVPACSPCDDSKQHQAFDEWMRSDKARSPKTLGVKDLSERIKILNAYVKHYGYVATKLEDRLVNGELTELRRIRTTLGKVRKEIEALIKDYGDRIGEEKAGLGA